MKSCKPVIILQGQIYLDDDKNCYIIVTKVHGEVIGYSGPGFKGQLEVETFLNRFQPVDPNDVSINEIDDLLQKCEVGTTTKIGFIKD